MIEDEVRGSRSDRGQAQQLSSSTEHGERKGVGAGEDDVLGGTRWQTANQERSCSYWNTWQIVVDNMRESRCLERTGGRRDDSSTPLFGRLKCVNHSRWIPIGKLAGALGSVRIRRGRRGVGLDDRVRVQTVQVKRSSKSREVQSSHSRHSSVSSGRLWLPSGFR